MGRIVVEVMPKPEILDPQGKAIGTGLERLGLTGFTGVRQGKLFHLSVEGEVTADVLSKAREATSLLSNPVIEDVISVREADDEEDSR